MLVHLVGFHVFFAAMARVVWCGRLEQPHVYEFGLLWSEGVKVRVKLPRE